MKKSICVFCGSRFGVHIDYKNDSILIGELLAKSNIRLVFGGGCVGLMGAVANAAIRNNGEVLGVIPEILIEKEISHDKVTELIIAKSMHERKQKMSDNADAFIVLPGGIGTMEEFFEVLTWNYLGIYNKPIGILNVNNYYDDLLNLLTSMTQNKFLEIASLNCIVLDSNPQKLVEKLNVMMNKEIE